MKKLFGLLFVVIVSGFAAQKVTFVEDPTPPFIVGELSKEPTGGIALKVIEKVFAEVEEAEPEFVALLPWKRSLKEVEVGQLDAIIHILKNPEREKKYVYSEMTYSGRSALFYSTRVFPDGFVWEGFKDLEKARICVLKGTSAESFLKKKVKEEGLNYKIAGVNDLEQCVKMIKIGRQDIFIDNEAVGYDLIRRTGMESEIKTAEKPLYSKEYYMAFSRNSEAKKFLPQINAALKKLRENGTIEKILKAQE